MTTIQWQLESNTNLVTAKIEKLSWNNKKGSGPTFSYYQQDFMLIYTEIYVHM